MVKIHASVLAADIFDLNAWLKNLITQGVDAFHIDLIDPSFANCIGLDSRIAEKISEMNIPFTIHYMAYWNDELIVNLSKLGPQKMFFHTKHIRNLDLFHKINGGIAIEVAEVFDLDSAINVDEYLLMSVRLGYCGQSFDEYNLSLSKTLKNRGKIITCDGGINIENISKVAHFDNIVIGSGLSKSTIAELKTKLLD